MKYSCGLDVSLNSTAICIVNQDGAIIREGEVPSEPAAIDQSFSERSNLTLRMHMRRFTRLTNAFSKKVENHTHAVALHMMYYNFVRIHQTLRTTPAMAAGVTKRLWEMTDVVDMLEAFEAGRDYGKSN
jgi:hypothetical protein